MAETPSAMEMVGKDGGSNSLNRGSGNDQLVAPPAAGDEVSCTEAEETEVVAAANETAAAATHEEIAAAAAAAIEPTATSLLEELGKTKRERAVGEKGEAADMSKRKKNNSEAMEEMFRCSICMDVLHDAVTLAPCLHNFCNFCFSMWYERAIDKGVCLCPTCRQNVSSASRNHMLKNLIEVFLKEHPNLQRSADQLAAMDEGALVKANALKFPPETSSVPFIDFRSLLFSPNLDDDEAASGEEEGCCRHKWGRGESGDGAPVAVPGSDGFMCSEETQHVTCTQCLLPVPLRDESVPIHCDLCKNIFCDRYWKEQKIPYKFDGAVYEGCHGGSLLAKMTERDWKEPLPNGGRLNDFEQQVMEDYMAREGITMEKVITSAMASHDTGEQDLLSSHLPASPNHSASALRLNISSLSMLCDSCAATVCKEISFQFRKSIPKEKLSVEVVQRPDCWYGICCRTQQHNPSHARRLNHACDPTR